MGYCTAYWIALDDRVLSITTAGKPQPSGIYHMKWSKVSELKFLPAEWKN
jgi:hypothetical protein